jgi:hypothetical protein
VGAVSAWWSVLGLPQKYSTKLRAPTGLDDRAGADPMGILVAWAAVV